MHPPLIDPRQLNDLVDEMKRLAPHYAPEWRFSPDDPDAGTALFYIFADIYLENVKRLNKVPLKHYMAFLNLMDIRQLPAQSARARVVFELSEGMDEPVHVAKNTRVSGKTPVGHDVYFETAESFMVTPAKLNEVISVSKMFDRMIRSTEPFLQGKPFQLYAERGENKQLHAFYLKHDRMLQVNHGVRVGLKFGNSIDPFLNKRIVSFLADPAKVSWLYYSNGGWVPFDAFETADDLTLSLFKNTKYRNESFEMAENEGYWIQCRLHRYDPEEAFLTVMKLDQIQMNSEYYETVETRGIEPDMLFNGDLQVSNNGHYPFGEEFQMFSSYYIASREVFCKSGTMVDLTFDLRWEANQVRPPVEIAIDFKMIMKKSTFEKNPPTKTSVALVAWEYWDGNTWAKLTDDEYSQQVLRYQEEVAECTATVNFRCPADFGETNVNGHDNYWIRMRIIKIHNLYSTDFLYMSPWISNMGLKYRSEGHQEMPELLFTDNNMNLLDQTQALRMPGNPVMLFEPLGLDQPAVYFGLDHPLEAGLFHIYVSAALQTADGLDKQIPLIEWEHSRIANGEFSWEPLKVIDGTQSFTMSGFIKFMAPEQMEQTRQFGRELYWIRAVNRDRQYELTASDWKLPQIRALYMNAVEVVQQETITDEYVQLYTDEEEWKTYYKLLNTPFQDEEVWIDETETIPEETMLAMEQADRKRIEIIRDSEDQVMQVWVRWTAVPGLAASNGGDRHYVVNRTTGMLQFGDGTKGMAPPEEGSNKIKVNYKKIEGTKGNLGAGIIKTLQQSVAFIEKVYNPEPAVGGCQPEPVETAITRGPALLQHRNRAVTAKDFEALAREANQNIAKVKCLSRAECPHLVPAGTVTICVQPKKALAAQADFPELKRLVETHLMERATQLVAFQQMIRIIEPAYLELSAFVRAAVTDTEELYVTEQAIISRLTEFLDPDTGHFDGSGWGIGETFHPSMLYGLLKNIPEIAVLKQISLTVHRIENGERTEIDPKQIPLVKHGVIISGTHRAAVELKTNN